MQIYWTMGRTGRQVVLSRYVLVLVLFESFLRLTGFFSLLFENTRHPSPYKLPPNFINTFMFNSKSFARVASVVPMYNEGVTSAWCSDRVTQRGGKSRAT